MLLLLQQWNDTYYMHTFLVTFFFHPTIYCDCHFKLIKSEGQTMPPLQYATLNVDYFQLQGLKSNRCRETLSLNSLYLPKDRPSKRNSAVRSGHPRSFTNQGRLTVTQDGRPDKLSREPSYWALLRAQSLLLKIMHSLLRGRHSLPLSLFKQCLSLSAKSHLEESLIFPRAPTMYTWHMWFSRSVMSDSFVTPRTVALQVPLSSGFPRQEYQWWVAISFSRGSSPCRDWTPVSCIGR